MCFESRCRSSINDTSCTPRVNPQVGKKSGMVNGGYSGHITIPGGNLSDKMALRVALPCFLGGVQGLASKRI